MEALTPASPDSLPALGELIADDPFWRYPSGSGSGEGVAHLRVWLTAGAGPGHLAVVTETGSADSVTESAGYPVRAHPLVRVFPCPARALPGRRGRGKHRNSRPGPDRHRRQPALDPHLADT